MKVEQLFDNHHIDEERKVSLTALSFQGPTMYWWTSLMTLWFKLDIGMS